MPLHPLPYPLPLGPFGFAEARDAGVSRSRLRAADVAHPHRGVYDPDARRGGLVTRCEQLLTVMGPDRWFSHLTAARLWGMPLPFSYRDDEPLHVVSWRRTARIRRPGIVGWRSDAVLPGALIDLLPVVSPSEVWCQLAVPGSLGHDPETGAAWCLDLRRLVAVADFLLTGPFTSSGRRQPLVDREELASAVRRRTGGRGIVALRDALESCRAPVHSAKETELRLALVDQGLPEPDVQVPVMTADGLRHADLGYPHARVLIEYHGDHHRTDQRQWREDIRRGELFRDAGYDVLTATAVDLDPPVAFASRVRRALAGVYFSR